MLNKNEHIAETYSVSPHILRNQIHNNKRVKKDELLKVFLSKGCIMPFGFLRLFCSFYFFELGGEVFVSYYPYSVIYGLSHFNCRKCYFRYVSFFSSFMGRNKGTNYGIVSNVRSEIWNRRYTSHYCSVVYCHR